MKIKGKEAFRYVLLLCAGLFFLISIILPEAKLFTVAVLLIGWLVVERRFNGIVASLLFLLISLTFNLTFIIPGFNEIPYVNGIFINFLSIYAHLLDLAILIWIASLILNIKISLNLKARYILLGVLVYLLIHNLLFLDLNVLLSSTRLAIYFLAAFITYLCRKELKELLRNHEKLILNFLVALLLFQLLLGAAQILRGASFGLHFLGESAVATGNVDSSSFSINGRLFLRGYGTFPHPNLLGGFAVIMMIYLLSGIKKIRDLRVDSRSSLLLLSAAIAFISFSQVAWFLTIFNLLVTFLFPPIQKKLSNISLLALLQNESRSLHERLILIENSLNYLRENLWLGVGSGNFTKGFYAHAPVGEVGMTLMQPVHNIFILILVEHGIIFGGGLISLLILYYIRQSISLQLILSAATLLTIGAFDHYLLTLPQGVALHFLILLLPRLSNTESPLNTRNL